MDTGLPSQHDETGRATDVNKTIEELASVALPQGYGVVALAKVALLTKKLGWIAIIAWVLYGLGSVVALPGMNTLLKWIESNSSDVSIPKALPLEPLILPPLEETSKPDSKAARYR